MTIPFNDRKLKSLIYYFKNHIDCHEVIMKCDAYIKTINFNRIKVRENTKVSTYNYNGYMEELTSIIGPTFVTNNISRLFEYMRDIPMESNIMLVFHNTEERIYFISNTESNGTVILVDRLLEYLRYHYQASNCKQLCVITIGVSMALAIIILIIVVYTK